MQCGGRRGGGPGEHHSRAFPSGTPLSHQRRSGRRAHSRWKEWQTQRLRIKDVEAGKACELGWNRGSGGPLGLLGGEELV